MAASRRPQWVTVPHGFGVGAAKETTILFVMIVPVSSQLVPVLAITLRS